MRGIDNNLHALKQLILDKTQGTPFFMEEIVQELFEQGVLVRDGVETRPVASLQSLEELGLGVPENLRQLIEHQFTRVNPDERRILEAASVAGAEFSAAAVAAGEPVSAGSSPAQQRADPLAHRPALRDDAHASARTRCGGSSLSADRSCASGSGSRIRTG